MKAHRFFGILWLSICGYFGINMLWGIRHEFTHYLNLRPIDYIGDLVCLMFLVGIVASIFLFRGARWARIMVGIIALLTGVVFIALFVLAFKSGVSIRVGVLGIFGLISAIVLLFPRRYLSSNT
jgi:hypothetical protein